MKIHTVALGLLLIQAATLRADNNVCTGAVLVVPDGASYEGDLDASTSRWYRFTAKAGRSYAIMLENLTPTDEQPEVAAGGLVGACGGPALPGVNEVLDPQEPASIGPTFLVGAARAAVKIGSDTNVFFAVGDIDTPHAAHFRVRVEETTLYAPTWSTRGGVHTVYRLFNTTNRGCSVTLDLRTDANGVPSGHTSTSTFVLASNSSVTRTTGAGDLGLGRDQGGHATIAHDCTPGAILAEAFLYEHGSPVATLKLTSARQQR